jgi:mannosyltransferase
VSSPRSEVSGRWLLAAITLLALVLRFSTIGVQSLWSDEGYTASIAIKSLSAAASQLPQTESTPPLYYALIWTWAHLFGSSAVMLRVPSAIAGTLTVPAV